MNAAMHLLQQCRTAARARPATIVFPDSLDARAIEAAHQLSESNYARPLLLANPFEMRHLCLGKGLPTGGITVIDPATSSRLGDYVAALSERMPAKSEAELRDLLTRPMWFAAAMVAAGDADLCIGGNVSSTADVLRAGLKVVGLAEGNRTLSSIFFMLPPAEGEPLGFADCGVVPEPGAEQLADIAIASADNYERVVGKPARVAMLSFSTRGSAKHAAVTLVHTATQLARERRPDLCIDGELQFDAATVPEVASRKAPDSVLEGRANVLVFPSLEAGNIGYKIAQRLGGYQALGPMVQGLRRPLHDLSRGCSTRDIVDVSLLAMKMAGATSPETSQLARQRA